MQLKLNATNGFLNCLFPKWHLPKLLYSHGRWCIQALRGSLSKMWLTLPSQHFPVAMPACVVGDCGSATPGGPHAIYVLLRCSCISSARMCYRYSRRLRLIYFWEILPDMHPRPSLEDDISKPPLIASQVSCSRKRMKKYTNSLLAPGARLLRFSFSADD